MEPSAHGGPSERSDNCSPGAPSIREEASASSAHAAIPGGRRRRALAPPRPLCGGEASRAARLPVTAEAQGSHPLEPLLGGGRTRARAGVEGWVDSEPSSLDQPREGEEARAASPLGALSPTPLPASPSQHPQGCSGL